MQPDPLFLSDTQILERVGIGAEEWRVTMLALERQGFPRPDPLFAFKRYWPACKAFLDRRYNLGASSIPAMDGDERWTENPDSKAARTRTAA